MGLAAVCLGALHHPLETDEQVVTLLQALVELGLLLGRGLPAPDEPVFQQVYRPPAGRCRGRGASVSAAITSRLPRRRTYRRTSSESGEGLVRAMSRFARGASGTKGRMALRRSGSSQPKGSSCGALDPANVTTACCPSAGQVDPNNFEMTLLAAEPPGDDLGTYPLLLLHVIERHIVRYIDKQRAPVQLDLRADSEAHIDFELRPW